MKQLAWQNELRQAVTKIDELCQILAIPICSVTTDYPMFVPRPFVDLMERGNPNDPLLLQVLPREEENRCVSGFSKDPLGEIAGSDNCHVLNKYAGRILLLASNHCGIHCRFCFRRHFPKGVNPPDVEALLEPIRSDTSIREVILSGGDPLTLDDDVLHRLFQSVIQIKHVKRLRIHSRLPVVLPNRITPELEKILTLPIPVYLVLHINHPNELSAGFLERRRLLTAPVLMTQTVLLREINDDVQTLYRLFNMLIDHRILPYYLHQLDRVEGAARFEVDSAVGCRLIDDLRQCLPGYAVPAYVREINGKTSKDIIRHKQ